MLRASLLLLLASLSGCSDRDSGPRDAPLLDGPTSELDAPGTDVPGLDASGLDASGLDASGLDASGLDASGLDAPGVDAGPGDAGLDAPLVSMPCTATGACDPFDPASCPAMQSCRLGPMGTECLPLAATVARVGEPCTRSDGCEAGATCLDFGAGFFCQRQCPAGSIGFCGEGQACTGSLGDACVRVCRPLALRCDIYAQDCDDPALACTLVTNGETGERYTGCRTPGTLGAGVECGGMLGTCARGLVCVREAGVSTCHAVCNTGGGGPDCAAPETCSGTTSGWGVRYCRGPG
jgi:hypothetical protein